MEALFRVDERQDGGPQQVRGCFNRNCPNDKFRKALYASQRRHAFLIGYMSHNISRVPHTAPPLNKFNLMARIAGVQAQLQVMPTDEQIARNEALHQMLHSLTEHNPEPGSPEDIQAQALMDTLKIRKVNGNQVKQNECCICLDEISADAVMVGQECNHWMHASCARISAQKTASTLGDGRTFFINPSEYAQNLNGDGTMEHIWPTGKHWPCPICKLNFSDAAYASVFDEAMQELNERGGQWEDIERDPHEILRELVEEGSIKYETDHFKKLYAAVNGDNSKLTKKNTYTEKGILSACGFKWLEFGGLKDCKRKRDSGPSPKQRKEWAKPLAVV